MELKKTPKADLQNKKNLFLEIGLSLALLAVFVAFNWKSSEKPEAMLIAGHQEIIEEEEQVPITEQMPLPQEIPQIPQIPEIIDIVDDEVDIPFDLDLSSVETGVFTGDDYLPQTPKVKDEEEIVEIIPFAVVEKKPLFQGQDASTFRDWINSQIEQQGYPASALENNIQGTVYLSFTVNTDGSLSDIKSVRKVDPILADAVIEIVKKSPKWTPGSQQNKPVKVPYQVPVVFRLQN